MTTKRGKKNDDVLRVTRYSIVELQDVRVLVGHLTYLAVLFFLSKHAEHRAEVYAIDGVCHGGCEDEG